MFRSILCLISFLVLAQQAVANVPLSTEADQVLLVDMETDTVLLEKNASAKMAPSSMSKLMVIYVLFKYLQEGRINLDTQFTVSHKAWKMGGSKMFVLVKTKIRVEDLIRGIVVSSGNDACIVVAEGISGTEEAFVELMNTIANEIGLKNSHFANVSGWADKDHYMTCWDLYALSKRLLNEFPVFYKTYMGQKEFTWSKIKQPNRNSLLFDTDYPADGLKTGHTDSGGYGVVTSAIKDGRRLMLVVNGFKSLSRRSLGVKRLVRWGFTEFSNVKLFEPGSEVVKADTWLGAQPQVKLAVENNVKFTVARSELSKIRAVAQYESPVAVPLKRGDKVGNLKIEMPNKEPVLYPLIAAEDVDRKGMFGRLSMAVRYLLFGAEKKPVAQQRIVS